MVPEQPPPGLDRPARHCWWVEAREGVTEPPSPGSPAACPTAAFWTQVHFSFFCSPGGSGEDGKAASWGWWDPQGLECHSDPGTALLHLL